MRASTVSPAVVVAALVLWPLAAPGESGASTYYVSTSGNDANPGTLSAPLRTSAEAVRRARPGDEVVYRSGTYDMIYVYPGGGLGANGTASQPIGYRTHGDGPVTLARIWIEGEHLEFRDFRLVGTGTPHGVGIFVAGRESPCCTYFQTNHVRFLGLEVTDFATGILGNCDDCEFLALDVHHNGYDWYESQGFYLAGSRNRIVGCTIRDNDSTGIQLWNTSDDPTQVPNHTLVANNLIYGNGFTLFDDYPENPDQYGYGIVLGTNGAIGEGNVLQGNLIFGNFPFGIALTAQSSNTRILNNTIVANVFPFKAEADATGVVFENNIVYRNGAEAVGQWLLNNRPELVPIVDPYKYGAGYSVIASVPSAALADYHFDFNLWGEELPFSYGPAVYASFVEYRSGSGQESHSLAQDPLFSSLLDPNQPDDLHLGAASPAIDAGTSLAEVTDDFDGTPRPQGAAYDIGADERPQIGGETVFDDGFESGNLSAWSAAVP